MTKKRRSYEAGHSPKFLVVIDDTPECDRAVYFASRRALRIGATVIMLRVIEMRDRNQQWLGVGDIMRAEAHEEANAVLDRYAARAASITGVMPDFPSNLNLPGRSRSAAPGPSARSPAGLPGG
jgi:hypothetical protein